MNIQVKAWHAAADSKKIQRVITHLKSLTISADGKRSPELLQVEDINDKSFFANAQLLKEGDSQTPVIILLLLTVEFMIEGEVHSLICELLELSHRYNYSRVRVIPVYVTPIAEPPLALQVLVGLPRREQPWRNALSTGADLDQACADVVKGVRGCMQDME